MLDYILDKYDDSSHNIYLFSYKEFIHLIHNMLILN